MSYALISTEVCPKKVMLGTTSCLTTAGNVTQSSWGTLRGHLPGGQGKKFMFTCSRETQSGFVAERETP